MPGLPKAVWLDSAGQTTGWIILDVQGEKSIHVDTQGRAYFKGFQFKFPALEWFEVNLQLHEAGCMYLFDDHMRVTFGGSWSGIKNGLAWLYVVRKDADWRCGEPGG